MKNKNENENEAILTSMIRLLEDGVSYYDSTEPKNRNKTFPINSKYERDKALRVSSKMTTLLLSKHEVAEQGTKVQEEQVDTSINNIVKSILSSKESIVYFQSIEKQLLPTRERETSSNKDPSRENIFRFVNLSLKIKEESSLPG